MNGRKILAGRNIDDLTDRARITRVPQYIELRNPVKV